jgi:hypothetical protein
MRSLGTAALGTALTALTNLRRWATLTQLQSVKSTLFWTRGARAAELQDLRAIPIPAEFAGRSAALPKPLEKAATVIALVARDGAAAAAHAAFAPAPRSQAGRLLVGTQAGYGLGANLLGVAVPVPRSEFAMPEGEPYTGVIIGLDNHRALADDERKWEAIFPLDGDKLTYLFGERQLLEWGEPVEARAEAAAAEPRAEAAAAEPRAEAAPADAAPAATPATTPSAFAAQVGAPNVVVRGLGDVSDAAQAEAAVRGAARWHLDLELSACAVVGIKRAQLPGGGSGACVVFARLAPEDKALIWARKRCLGRGVGVSFDAYRSEKASLALAAARVAERRRTAPRALTAFAPPSAQVEALEEGEIAALPEAAPEAALEAPVADSPSVRLAMEASRAANEFLALLGAPAARCGLGPARRVPAPPAPAPAPPRRLNPDAAPFFPAEAGS